MRGELVAFDLETTGLDIGNDSIIEIGAVRMKDGTITHEFSTLINPGFVIPLETTHITGIHQDDLKSAPMLPTVLPEIESFIGDCPVIAHNVMFDVGFMRRYHILQKNLPLDTFELASILLPGAPRYSLSALAEQLEIKQDQAHRALDDARAAACLYWLLWERALKLPISLLREITDAAKSLTWEHGVFFETALQEREGISPAALETEPFQPLTKIPTPLQPVDTPGPVDVEAVTASIGADGALARHIPHYEHRQEQIEMVRLIAEAFNNNQHLLIEASTGTGKSLAYLIPAIRWAQTNGMRVVIATNTINLQEQLINKDVPLLKAALDGELKAAVMKGRNNYLCPRRLAALRRRKPANLDELRTLAKVLVWLQESQTGDRGEITLRAGEYGVWDRLSARDEGCTLHRCSSVMAGACPFYKARKCADAAHVVIANHALLISDATSENHVLPEYQYLIVDEAHQLEDAITNGMSIRIDQISLLRRLNDLGDPVSGILGDLLRSARNNAPDKRVIQLEGFIQVIAEAVRDMQADVRLLFRAVYEFLRDASLEGHFAVRVSDKLRRQGGFAGIQAAWRKLSEFFDAIVEALNRLAAGLGRLEQYDIPDFDDHLKAINAAGRYFNEVHVSLHHFTLEPDTNTVYWINGGNSPEHIALQAAPLHVGPLMEEHLWRKKESVILTSATLQAGNSFQYLRDRLYADQVNAVALGSPFDYRASTLVYVPDDMPEPNRPGYQRAVERGLIELAAALNGRVMALFTSYSQLRETAANIAPRLALGNIIVFDQASGGSREALLDSFKSTEKAVLLGTRSFWQGVDIPGDDLSALVIVRLPFAVPTDPIFSARSEAYDNAFLEFAVPDAILRFRQGFGRLIRTRTDRGIVAILDTRIISKSYGLSFLESLPECTVKYGALADLASSAADWLQEPDEA